jgi:aquaporin Z
MDKNLARAYAAEFVGTFAMVFIGAGAVCVNYLTNTDPHQVLRPGLVGIALAQGLALAVALSVTLHISGGYLNPAVTLMLWCFNRLDTIKTAWYVGAQLVGAALAGFCLYNLFGDDVLRASRLGTPHVNLQAFHADEPTWGVVLSGAGIELVLTFFLVLAIFGTILDPRGQRTAGLMVGLALAAATFMGFPLTGAATNPARWFGTVFWERLIQDSTLDAVSPFADMFVYVAGPVIGAMLAGVFYQRVIVPAAKDEPLANLSEPDVGHPSAAAPAGKGKK